MQKIEVEIPVGEGKTRKVEAEFGVLGIKKFIPYENNAKEHPPEQIKSIIESIKNSGFRDPIQVDENNIILSGHGRLEACKQLGMKKIPFIRYKDLSESEKIAYRLDTNRTAELGIINNDIIKLEMEKIEIKDYQMDLYDFALQDIDYDVADHGQITDFDKVLYSEQQEEVIDADDIEEALETVENMDTNKNVVRGIQIPVRQEYYDETFAEFKEFLKSGRQFDTLFIKFLKDANAENKQG